jgi:hypothetical protein
MNSRLHLLKVVVLCVTLSACQTNSNKPADLPKKLAIKSEATLEPDDQLYKALEAFAKGDYFQSSADIKAAAQSMREIEKKEKDERRKAAIEKAAKALDVESNKIAKKQVEDITTLYPSLGQTGRALAGSRLTSIEDEFNKHNEEKAGAILTKTVMQLEKSITTHHRALNAREQQVLSDAMSVAGHLKKGDKVDQNDLKKVVHNIDAEIEKWNKEFEIL